MAVVADRRPIGLRPKWLGRSRPPRLQLFSRAFCWSFGTCNAPTIRRKCLLLDLNTIVTL